jgi:hypothetical protein
MQNVLDHYVQELFPHAYDNNDHRIIFKIDGGPGRMNMELLAELWCLGVYLFPEVQNTTHVAQETDPKLLPVQSQLRKNIQTLTTWQAAHHREQIALHESDPTLYRYPATLPSLSRANHPRLIGGCSTTDPILLPAFQNSFSSICFHGVSVEPCL